MGTKPKGEPLSAAGLSCLRAAVAYARMGWHVLPVNGKLPLTEHGVDDASTDEQVLRGWWRLWPDAGVAVSLWPSGLVLVDVDTHSPEANGFESLRALEAEHGELPDTPTAATGGGGMHAFLARSEGLERVRAALAPGLECKLRGYAVLEPSLHPSGKRYLWRKCPESCPPREPSEKWLALVRAEERAPNPAEPARPPRSGDGSPYGLAALCGEAEGVANAPDGERNTRLNTAAFKLGRLAAGGEVPEELAADALLSAARACGLPEREAEKTVRSGLGAGMREPRSAPPCKHAPTVSEPDEPPPWEPADGEPEPEVVLPEEPEVFRRARQFLNEQERERCEPSGGGGEPEEWLLSPFEELERPEFPASVFPTELRQWVEELARELEVPLALPGCLALGALAACVSNRLCLEVRPEYFEPLNLSLAVALPPAERKSAVFAAAFKPLQEWEQRAVERERPRVRELQEERRALEKRVEHLHGKLAKVAEPYERGNLLAEVQELATKLECSAVPALPRLLADDTTPERLAVLMSEHDGRMAVASSEGGLFDALAGRYSDGRLNLDVYLKSWSGDMLSVDRVGRAPVHIDKPALTVTLALQPSVLQGLASQPAFRGRGLLARFLFALPGSALGGRTFAGEPLSVSTRNAYHRLFGQHLDAELDGEVLQLSPEARGRWLAFALEVEPRLKQGGGAGQHGGLGREAPRPGCEARRAPPLRPVPRGPTYPPRAPRGHGSSGVPRGVLPRARSARILAHGRQPRGGARQAAGGLAQASAALELHQA